MSNISRRTFAAAAVTILTVTAVSACGLAGTTPNADGPLRVVASSTPHADILKEIERSGLIGQTKLQITEISGDLDPNELLAAGDVDANFFQHQPYLNSWLTEKGGEKNLVSLGNVHVEPLGIYSRKIKDLQTLPEGARVAIPKDVTNFARGLFLLQDAGLLTLDVKPTDPRVDFNQVKESNITANPKKISFVPVERAQLPNSLDDAQVQLSIINGNYALEAGLKPDKDALKLETAKGNPYANILVTKSDKQQDPRIVALAKAITSPEIAKWIAERYQGSVIPVAEGKSG